MGKNSMTCPWGDCPGLGHGPKSREHEDRFTKRNKAENLTMKNNSATMINDNSGQNHANG
jgi:hypothetical protein